MKWRYAAYAFSIAGLGWAALAGDPSGPRETVSQVLPARLSTSGVRGDPSHRAETSVAADEELVRALVPRARLFAGAAGRGPATAFMLATWALPAPAASTGARPAAPAAPPFAYVGRQFIGTQWQVLVADKDDVPRVVQVGDLVDEQYRVVSIDAGALVVEHLPSRTSYSIPLE